MIKAQSNSSPVIIKKWAYKKSKAESIPHWQEMITSIDNVDLLLTLASDEKCPQRAVILKCLYSIVGNSVSKHVESDIQKITSAFDKVQSTQDHVILNLVNRSKSILRDLRKYDYIEWCQGGFVDRDLPVV